MSKDSRLSQVNPILIASISILGVIVGATLQYFVTLKTEREKHWVDTRTKTYIQYVENTSKISEETDAAKIAEFRSLRKSARFLTALYRSKNVVKQMAVYAKYEDESFVKGSKQEEEFKQNSMYLFNTI